jgi:DNA repair protein SbcC/Rad50
MWMMSRTNEWSLNKHSTGRRLKHFRLITDTGTRLKQKLDASNQAIGKYQESLKEKELQQDTLQQQLAAMQAEVINSQVDTDNLPGYAELKETISSLERELSKQVNMPDVDALKRDKMVVKLRIDDINKTLALKDMIAKSMQRIAELEQEQQTLAQELADMEKTEFTIQAFERAKVESLERKVNNMFELVKFKLFDTQINGQEIPTCQATYQNVPYADLNTAMKINCGIDIINTMCKHEGITAPIFVDHAESVTRLHHTDSQLIRLVVSEKHATLTLS